VARAVDRGELDREDAAASTVTEYEAHIAALELEVGQLTMELDLLKKTPRLQLVSNNENSSIISEARPAPFEGDAK
jgi:transposase